MGIVVHSHPAEDIRVHSASPQTHLCTLDARHRVTAAMKDYTADIILVNKLGGSIISMDLKKDRNPDWQLSFNHNYGPVRQMNFYVALTQYEIRKVSSSYVT